MKKRIFTILLIIVICMGVALRNNTFAVDPDADKDPKKDPIIPLIDLDAIGEAVIQFRPDNIRAKNVMFRVYKVADVTEDYKFELTEPYKKYNISLEDAFDDVFSYAHNDEWKKIASTLASYIEMDKINPTYTAKTNELGNAYIDRIGVGVYLVLGDQYITEDYIYTPVPFLMSIPTYNEDKEKFYYNVTAYVKYTKEPRYQLISKRVILVWDDVDKATRPKSIKVWLIRDDEIYEEVELNEANNWRYTWDNLSTKYKWAIMEAVEINWEDFDYRKYASTFEDMGATFVITKKYRPVEPKPEPEILPQTGVLWWPVPVCAICGIIIFLVGFMRYKGDENGERGNQEGQESNETIE